MGITTITASLGTLSASTTLAVEGETATWSTYFGAGSNDYATAITVDPSGNVYVAGYTYSPTLYTTPGAFQSVCGSCTATASNAFVLKMNSLGYVEWATFLGGSGSDVANGIAVDSLGNIDVVGQTKSANFPTKTAYQSKCGKTNCATGAGFAAQFSPTGQLNWSTYIAGKSQDQVNAIALDAAGNIHAVGFSQSANFPTTTGAYQPTCSKCPATSAVVIFELSANGETMLASTYLYGNGQDVGYGIALDSAGNTIVVGYTRSSNFPATDGSTLGAAQAGFVTKFNPTLTGVIYSIYFGGTTTLTTPCEACATGVAVDAAGNAVVVGLTAETNFPATPGAYQTVLHSTPQGHDAWAAKLDPTGHKLWATYLGGAHDDGATTVALDALGDVWLKGNTESTDFPQPSPPNGAQTTSAGGYDAFIAELDPTGSMLLYSTYWGGSGNEYTDATQSLAVTANGLYFAGATSSTDFPIQSAYQPASGGDYDAFVVEFSPAP